MLWEPLQTLNILLDQLWRAMVVVEHTRYPVANSMVGLPKPYIDRKNRMNHCEQEGMKLVLQKFADTYYVSVFLSAGCSCSGMRLCLGQLMWLWKIRLGIVSNCPNASQRAASIGKLTARSFSRSSLVRSVPFAFASFL